MTAHSARLAVPWGSSWVWLYFPDKIPSATAHYMASCAKSLTFPSSWYPLISARALLSSPR